MNDRIPGSSSSNPIIYEGPSGKWEIFLNPYWTSHADTWAYMSENYDGDEDSRHGSAASSDACIQDIKERFEDEE